MTRAEDPLTRAQRVTAELRAAISEAAGVPKDLQRGMKQAREQVDGYYATQVKAELDRHTRQWDAELTARLKTMIEDVNRVAGRSRDRAEAAIDTAMDIEAAAELLTRLMTEHTRITPEGGFLHYGDLTNPDSIELNP